MAKIGDLLVKIGADVRDLDKDLAKARGKFKSFGRTMKTVGRNMSMSITAPLAAVAGSSFKVAMDFEASMAKVKAVSGATAEEFGRLEAQAKLLGKSTVFTASDVASLQTEFAKLGFTAQEIDKVTESTLYLAQATGSDLGQAAEVAGATLRGFGMDASETGRVTDVMAKSFSTSALDMDSFADSMKYVGPVAKAAGLSIEDTTAMLGTLANAGIKGSAAGTALRRILADMGTEGGPVTEQIAAMAEKGLTLEDAFDEVGRSAQTALLVLSENTGQTAELSTEFQNAAGASKAMADTMNDTSQGAFKRMQSAIEGAQIALGEALAPAMESIMGVVENLAGKFSGLSSTAQNIVVGFGGFLALLGPMLLVLPQIGGAIEMLGPVVKKMGPMFTKMWAAMTGPVGIAIAVIAAVVAAVYYFRDEVSKPIADVINYFIKLYNEIEFVRVIVGAIKGVVQTVFDFFAFAVQNVIESFKDLGGIVLAIFKGDFSAIPGLVSDAFAGAADRMKIFGEKAGKNIREGIESEVQNRMEFVTEEMVNQGISKLGELGDYVTGLLSGGGGGGGATVAAATAPVAMQEMGGRRGAAMVQAEEDKLVYEYENLIKGQKISDSGDDPVSYYKSLGDSLKGLHSDLAMTIDLSGQVEGALNGMGMAIGGLISGTMSMQDIFAQSMMGIANLLMDLGGQFIAAGVAAMSFYQSLLTNPAVAIAAGVGLVAAGAAIKGFQSRMQESPPKLAEGGLAYGMTTAIVGEYGGAKSNPEVIAPLNKLQGIMEGGKQNVQVTGRISGKDIVLSNERGTRARNRTK